MRRLVEENKLDPKVIKGTGRDGRLTKEDVLAHMSSVSPQPKAAEVVKKIPVPISKPGIEGVRREPMSRIRKRIAETLVTAQQLRRC